VEDGDHVFTPRKTSASTERQNWDAALGEIVTLLEGLHDQKESRRPQGSR
jgi:hypothetical protein